VEVVELPQMLSCRANRPPLALTLSRSGRTNGSYL
jgi:hypothetical protein